jgi:hypothetical protein
MDLLLGGVLVFGLLVALLLVRRAANARKRAALKARRTRGRAKPRPLPQSSRGEMRAYDDPTTFADTIPTRERMTDSRPPASVTSRPTTRGRGSGK